MRDYRDAFKVEQAKRQYAERSLWRAENKNRGLQAAADRHPLKHLEDHRDREALNEYLEQLGWLIAAAHPLQGHSDETMSKSADTAPVGAATQWARMHLRYELRELRDRTGKLQARLETEHGERVVVDSDGKCVACGKMKRSRRGPKNREG